MNNDECFFLQHEEDLSEIKRNRILDQKCRSILKDFSEYIIFIFLLFEVTFSNLNNSALQYNILFQSNFVDSQSPNEINLYNVSALY